MTKNVLFPLFFLFLPLCLSAQLYVEKKDILAMPDVTYLEITNRSGLKTSIVVNYGQEQQIFSNDRLTDEKGENLIFNSIIDTLNFFDKKGFGLLTIRIDTEGDSPDTFWYLLKRKK